MMLDRMAEVTRRGEAIASLPRLAVPAASEVLRGPATECVESPAIWARPAAEFVADLSGASLSHVLLAEQPHERHGLYLTRVPDAVLFGHHHLHAAISAGLRFDCQDIQGYRSRLDYHVANHPGRTLPMPQIYRDGDEFRVDMMPATGATAIAATAYLGTPIEPLNWGMWLLQAIPAATDFMVKRRAEKFLCYAAQEWQQKLLRVVGVPLEALVQQELGQSYRCADLVLRQYSHIDLVPTPLDKELYARLARQMGVDASRPASRRVFLSRRGATQRTGGRYRALVNEADVVALFASRGFEVIEPETLAFEDQIRVFSESAVIVGLGGAALFNTVFCRPNTLVVTIESSVRFVHNHAMLLGALGHRFGVIFGAEDASDSTPVQKRWYIDVVALASVARSVGL